MKPVWILCNPRCGSSYLCELLNHTEKFEQVFNGRSFGEWLKHYQTLEQFASKPPAFNKCTRHQFVSLFGEMKHRHLEEILPGIRYVLIHRRDLFAQSVSMYIAKRTDQYHLFSERSKSEYMSQEVELDEELLLKMYRNALNYPTAWTDFLKGCDFLELYYEDLILHPANILDRVCTFLGISLTQNEILRAVAQHRLIPTTRPEAETFINKLKTLVGENQA